MQLKDFAHKTDSNFGDCSNLRNINCTNKVVGTFYLFKCPATLPANKQQSVEKQCVRATLYVSVGMNFESLWAKGILWVNCKFCNTANGCNFRWQWQSLVVIMTQMIFAGGSTLRNMGFDDCCSWSLYLLNPITRIITLNSIPIQITDDKTTDRKSECHISIILQLFVFNCESCWMKNIKCLRVLCVLCLPVSNVTYLLIP